MRKLQKTVDREIILPRSINTVALMSTNQDSIEENKTQPDTNALRDSYGSGNIMQSVLDATIRQIYITTPTIN